MIVIVDYEIGNLRSIQNMLRRGGSDAVVSRDRAVISQASRLILPGVGHFRYGMEALRRFDLIGPLTERVMEHQVPVLGICLGAQLMGEASEEGNVAGLGWVRMRNVAFRRAGLTAGDRVPHMGWAETGHSGNGLFTGIENPARFYYVHSYHFECDDRLVTSSVQHGYRFPAAFAIGNVFGVQFHPEKSHAFGMRLLRNFAQAS